MTTYYVDGTNGNDAYDGTSATFTSGSTGPKRTLTAVEALLAAGDTVYVRSGVYRETLTCGVSGTNGNPITYIGDYTGTIWTGGGVVRITGSNDDKTATRASCITATSRNYRTFRAFAIEMSSGNLVDLTNCTYFNIEQCYLAKPVVNSTGGVVSSGAGQGHITISRCFFLLSRGNSAVLFTHTSGVDNSAHIVSNCIVLGMNNNGSAVNFTRVGGGAVNNITTLGCQVGVTANTLTAGQTTTVNNCVLTYGATALVASVLGEITEDYNALIGNQGDRSNVATGTHSNSWMGAFDSRWFFQLVTAAAANQVVTPFDLASYSQLINLAGTSPTTTDLRGTSAIGGTREWGALEYDSSLKIQGGGGGAVSIGPSRRGLGG